MILAKTTEYALTILGFMATRNEPVYSAEFLHQELHIPRRYLRRLLTDLAGHGFIASTKGRNGGFVFARNLGEINFANIIETLEGTDILNRCLMGFTCCLVDKPCIMHDSWTEASNKMKEVLSGTTLESLRTKYQADNQKIEI